MIAITESWLSPDIPGSVINLDGFYALRNDRNVHGGGLVLYLYESLTASVICWSPQEYCPDTIALLMREISKPFSLPTFVAVVYRPPRAAFTTSVDFSAQLLSSMEKYRHEVILGDFNVDQLRSSSDAEYIKCIMRDYSLKLVDHGVTHVTGTSETWLNLCLADESDSITSWGISSTPLGACHHLISVELDIQRIRPAPKIITTRRLGKLVDVQTHAPLISWIGLDSFLGVVRVTDLDEFYSFSLVSSKWLLLLLK